MEQEQESSMMDKAEGALKRLKKKGFKGVKEDVDNFLNEKVNLPLADAGYPKTGIGLSAAASGVADFLIPDSAAEGAASMLIGPALKGAKGLKALARPLAEGAEDAGKLKEILMKTTPAKIVYNAGEDLKGRIYKLTDMYNDLMADFSKTGNKAALKQAQAVKAEQDKLLRTKDIQQVIEK